MVVYYQMQQVLLQTAKEVSYKKGKSFLLQNASYSSCDNFIVICDSYYKIPRLLQIVTVQL